MCVSSPWSMLLWSGLSAPPPAEVVVTPPETSLSGSLRLALSDSKRTREPERRLMSGDRSDPPGRSSALVGVTVKRTDAIIAHLKETGVEGHYVGEEGRGRRSHGLASRAELSWARLFCSWCWGNGVLYNLPFWRWNSPFKQTRLLPHGMWKKRYNK